MQDGQKKSDNVNEINDIFRDRDTMAVGSAVLNLSDFISTWISAKASEPPSDDLTKLVAITSAMMLAAYAEEEGLDDLLFERVIALKTPGIDPDSQEDSGHDSGKAKTTWMISIKKTKTD